MVYLLYPSTSAHIFATLQCEEFDDPSRSRFLRKDLSIDCRTPFHQAMMVYAYVMILVYPLGVPLWYVYIFRRYHKELHLISALELNRASLQKHARNERQLAAANAKVAGELSANGGTQVAELPPVVQEEVLRLQKAEDEHRSRLPDYVQKLIVGYELRTYYFELIEYDGLYLSAHLATFHPCLLMSKHSRY